MYDVFGHNKLGQYIDTSKLFIDKNKSYQLYDDDIYTGETMRIVSSRLKSIGITINSYFSFNVSDPEMCEVLDNRDFIIFGKNSGLVTNNTNIRLPYVYPFVDPLLRCSITNPLQFSIDVWKYNYSLCVETNTTLIETPQYDLFKLIGFDGLSLISDICLYYIKVLSKF